MKRIHRAINEGLDAKLIDFGGNDLKKTAKQKTPSFFKDFKFGDFVFYNPKLGYNNYDGEKVARCISDIPGKELYISISQPLVKGDAAWANEDTKLYNDPISNFGDGWENTLYVLNNYNDDLDGTIWSYLKKDEYIPSANELMTIYSICNGTALWDKIGFDSGICLSSSTRQDSKYNEALGVNFFTGLSYNYKKWLEYHSVILLNIY